MNEPYPDPGGSHEPREPNELRDLVAVRPSRRFLFVDADSGAVAYFGCEYEGEVAISRADGGLVGSFASTASAFQLIAMTRDLRWIWLDPEPAA